LNLSIESQNAIVPPPFSDFSPSVRMAAEAYVMYQPPTCRLLRPLRFLAIALAVSAGIPFLAAGVLAPAHAAAAASSHFGPLLAQGSDDEDDNEVPPDQIEKYVAVYRDMQRDRSLTVESAAAKEGLTVSAFRQLEQKVEHDDAALERARSGLQAAASQSSASTSSPEPKN